MLRVVSRLGGEFANEIPDRGEILAGVECLGNFESETFHVMNSLVVMRVNRFWRDTKLGFLGRG